MERKGREHSRIIHAMGNETDFLGSAFWWVVGAISIYIFVVNILSRIDPMPMKVGDCADEFMNLFVTTKKEFDVHKVLKNNKKFNAVLSHIIINDTLRICFYCLKDKSVIKIVDYKDVKKGRSINKGKGD